MWTTDALTNAGGWDLFSAIFFIFILYKAFTKSGRELVKSFLENCFKKVKNKEEKEIRNKFRGYLILAIFVLIYLLVTLLAPIIVFLIGKN